MEMRPDLRNDETLERTFVQLLQHIELPSMNSSTGKQVFVPPVVLEFGPKNHWTFPLT